MKTQSEKPVPGTLSMQTAPKIHLMFVSGSLAGGGAERFVSTMLQHLNRRKFSLSLCLLKRNIKYSLPDDVRVFDLQHESSLQTLRTRMRLKNIVEQHRPDVILSNLDATGQYVGEALSGCSLKPGWIARTSNSPDQTFRGARGRLRRLRLNRVYPSADFFVANSQGVAHRFADVFPFSQSRLRVIGNPVDVEQLSRLSREPLGDTKRPDVPVLFWMGRLCQQKRLDVLIDAFCKVRAVRPAKLHICAGKGPLLAQVRRRISRLNLTDSVTVLPFQRNPFPLVAAADIAFSTSDFEGLSNSVIEAQALGVPVVATRCDFGNEEIVSHNESGILTARGNADEVAAATLKMLGSDEQRRAMGRAARSRIRELYDVSRTMPVWEDLLLEAALQAKSKNDDTRLFARAA